MVTFVVYVPDGALLKVNVTVPYVPVVPLADHDCAAFVSVTETDAPATGLARLSLRATVTLRCLLFFEVA